MTSPFGVWVVVATIAAGLAGWVWQSPVRRVPAGRDASPDVPRTGSVNAQSRDRPPVARALRSPATLAAWLSRIRARNAPDVVGLLAALAAELEAGQVPEFALDEAGRGLDPDPCPRARTAARIGADVAESLRADATTHGSSGLRALAACWEVSGRSGSGLAASVRRLADAERASKAARGELLAELATVRASARLLAGLPMIGLLMGGLLGAEPLGWLTATGLGRLTLLGGLLFQGAGLLWLRRIVARARRAIP